MFEGVFTPLITPFESGDSFAIDWKGWSEAVEHQMTHGTAIIVGATTGEVYALTPHERVQQFRRAKDIIGGKNPLLGGVNSFRTEECCDFARAAREEGMDGILLAAPPYSQPDSRELAGHCLAIERAAGLPIMLYNYPGRTGTDMDREFLERIGRNANFQAIKESSGDIDRLHLLARRFPHIRLFCGMDNQALEFFAWGACGWVSAAGNSLPDEISGLTDVCVKRGDFAVGRRMMSALLPLMNALETGGKFIASVKYLCELEGLSGGNPRPPLHPLKKDEKRRLSEIVHTLKTTMRHIQQEETI